MSVNCKRSSNPLDIHGDSDCGCWVWCPLEKTAKYRASNKVRVEKCETCSHHNGINEKKPLHIDTRFG